MATEEHPTVPLFKLDVSHISLVLLVLGAYLCSVGQLSYLLKEKAYMSSALLAVTVGIVLGPSVANVINPLQWVGGDVLARNEVTYQLTRVVIGIQVMFAGIDLPGAYLWTQRASLTMLLLPVMVCGWFVSAGFILLFVPSLTFLECLAVASAVTPTDPILAASIVKGRFAEKYVPKPVRELISAESGANDGLGFPFLFIAVFLMDRHETQESLGGVIRHWLIETWLYQLALAAALGALIGWLARKTLQEAHRRQLIDHESFLAYGIGLSFFTLGVVGVLGSDDIFACFIAGNSLTWRNFYVNEMEDETFQDVIDGLLNVSIFIYLGAIIPWSAYTGLGLVPWKMVLLAICLLLFRRLPFVLLCRSWIPAVPDLRQAVFCGWFGPVGVSAVYYAMLALREVPAERTRLREVIAPIVLFIAFSSTLVHGISIPLTLFAPRAFTRTRSFASEYYLRSRPTSINEIQLRAPIPSPHPAASPVATPTTEVEREVAFKI